MMLLLVQRLWFTGWSLTFSPLLAPFIPPSHPFVTSPSRPVRRRTRRASCCPPSWRPPCWLKTAKSSVCSKTSSGCSSRYRKSRRRRPIRSWSWNASWPTRRKLSRWAVREGDGRLVGPRRRDFYRREIKLLLCFFFFFPFQRLEAKLQSQMDYEEIKTELRWLFFTLDWACHSFRNHVNLKNTQNLTSFCVFVCDCSILKVMKMASANGSSSQVRVLLRRLYCSLSKLDLFAFPPNVPPSVSGKKNYSSAIECSTDCHPLWGYLQPE